MTRMLFWPLALMALAPLPVSANDTEAHIAMGGLIFEQNDQISMDSEDLYLSLDTVRVRYSYTNHSDRPITLLVAFPLPDVPLEDRDPEWIEAAYPDWDAIEMKTLVNGKPAGLMRIDIAKVRGMDVGTRLKQLGWPSVFWKDPGFADRLKALSADEKSALVAEGLLTTDGVSDGNVRPGWTIATSFVRTQTFPPGVPITVEHSYRPFQGGSVASGLDREFRGDTLDPSGEYATRYCVDQAFLRGYDRKRYLPSGRIDDRVIPLENWIGYKLSPGANWKGRIGRFRLTVDKGYPDRLVSLCMDGLTKVSPTRFEVVKTDYEPDRDLDLLFVALLPSEGGQ